MASVVEALKQAWWAPVAGLLALIELLMVPGFAFGDDAAVDAALALAGALLLAAGLWNRPHAVGSGTVPTSSARHWPHSGSGPSSCLSSRSSLSSAWSPARCVL